MFGGRQPRDGDFLRRRAGAWEAVSAAVVSAAIASAGVADHQFTIYDGARPTAKAQFSADLITAGATRTFTLPDQTSYLAASTAQLQTTRIPFGAAGGLLAHSDQLTWDDTNFIAQWKITGGTPPAHAASTALRVIRNASTTASCSLALVGGNAASANSLYFSDDAAEDAGTLRYSHSTDQFSLRIQGSAYLTLASTLCTHATAVALPAGAVGAPALYLSSDTTTGFYRVSSNQISVAVSGVQALTLGSTQNVSQFKFGVGAGSSAAAVNIQTPTAGTLVTGTGQSGLLNSATTSVDGTCTSSFYAVRISGWGTAATAHTTASLGGLAIGVPSIGAGSTPDKIAGIAISDPTTGATFNSAIFIGSTTLSGTGNWSIYNSATSASYLGSGAIRIGNSSSAVNTDEQLTVIKMAASGGSSVQPVLVWGSNVSGAPSSGFGASEVVVLEATGSNNNRFAAQRDVLWANATDATRKGRVVEYAWDATAARECIRMESDGSAAMLGFFGVSAVVRRSAYTQTFATASRTVNAYTSDAESVAYTGIDNAQVGTVYAQLADLNNLRVAYENLRAMADNLQQVVNSLIDDSQALGLAA